MDWYRCIENARGRRDRDLPLYIVVCSRCVEAAHAIMQHYRLERAVNRPWHCAICGRLDAPHTEGETLFAPLDVAWPDRDVNLWDQDQAEAIDGRTEKAPE